MVELQIQLIRAMQENDEFSRAKFKELQKKYPNKYVAIEKGRVIAAEKNLGDLNARVSKLAEDPRLVLIEFVPERGMSILF